MIDEKEIRDNTEEVEEKLARRGSPKIVEDIYKIAQLSAEIIEARKELDKFYSYNKAKGRAIGNLKQAQNFLQKGLDEKYLDAMLDLRENLKKMVELDIESDHQVLIREIANLLTVTFNETIDE